ncbi:MAG: 4-(cytidine 5'-diphospho)-2-C-methyl-D-erythritol kinase [Paludibacteraceae bacterium]|nr:4-(cytidine 5'-diphospho)-2-C-methyl-D-erythritol kinase [Paludibacteraceae bacterium]
MTLYPNCKINIGLRVVSKREDGYHNLETIFYPVYGLHDVLEVTPLTASARQSIDFRQEGIVVDCAEEDNLIVRCYRQIAARYPQIGSVQVHFTKNIPFGAGLGGGSSDAAHMAIALNELFRLGLTKEQLVEQVKPLGADCPFFIYNTPCFAEGIGDLLTPIDMNLTGMRLVMVKPDISVSTRDAYAGLSIQPAKPAQPAKLAKPAQPVQPAKLTQSALPNDFESTVFVQYPLLAQIKQRLLDAGAVYAAMSGSGSTIYGLFQDNAESGADTRLRMENEDFASMIIFNDTLTQR